MRMTLRNVSRDGCTVRSSRLGVEDDHQLVMTHENHSPPMDWYGRGRSAAGGSHPTPTRTHRREGGRRRPRGRGRSGRCHRVSTGSGPAPTGAAPRRHRGTVGAGHYSYGMLIGAHVREDDPVASAAAARRRDRADVPGRPAGLEEAPGAPAGRGAARGAADGRRARAVRRQPRLARTTASASRRASSWPSTPRARPRSARSGWWCTAGTSPRRTTPPTASTNWRKFLARQADEGGFPVPVLIENTAGGDHAMARRFDALARLWDAVGEFGVGFCLDTCHAHAAGEELADAVDRIKAITGRIDLVHLNDSRDAFGSGADRHANVGAGHDRPGRAGRRVRRGGRPGGGRDPGGGPGRGHRVPARAARLVTP